MIYESYNTGSRGWSDVHHVIPSRAVDDHALLHQDESLRLLC